MKLTKRDIAALRNAIRYAIEYEESFIDAHREQFNPDRIIRGSGSVVRHTRRTIAGWKRLRTKLESL